MTNKPILCLDFDGVCHMYTSPWTQPWEIADGPVPGLFPFLEEAMAHFQIAIFSSRSMYANGREAMQEWFDKHARELTLALYSRAAEIADTMVRSWKSSAARPSVPKDLQPAADRRAVIG